METFWDNKWLTQGQATAKKKEEDWDDGNDSDLQFLVDMGFDWKEAKSCYLDADKNVEKAAAMLSSATEEREKAKKKTRG